MKTAKDWCDEKCHNMRGGFEFSRGDIRRIQADALREAARIAQLTQDRPHDYSDVNYRSGLHWMRDEIQMNINEAAKALDAP